MASSEATADSGEPISIDEFASIVAHDLRNPLTVAAGYLSLIEGNEESVEAIENSLERADEIISDLLLYARNDQVEERETIELAEAAELAWGEVETGDGQLVAETDLRVRAQYGLLKQVLENLFRNAVEHGQPADGTPLTVTVGSLGADHPPEDWQDNDVGFYVEDNGPGIPEGDRETVLDVGVSTNPDGTGLGLPIVARFAAREDWTMHVRAGSEGGARFEFSGVRPGTGTGTDE